MLIDFETSPSVVLQHTLSGTGAFTGVEVGRSSLTIGAGNGAMVFKARHFGTDPHTYTVRIADPKRLTPAIVVRWKENDRILQVVPAHNGTAITSTAAQVAAAVAELVLPITCDYGGTGVNVAIEGSGALAGGLDPTAVRQTMFKFIPAANVNGGLLVFNQPFNIVVQQVEARLAASALWTLSAVNLDEGLREITGESVVYATSTSQDIFLANLNIVLAPLRALKFVSATQGVVRACVHRQPNFPLK